MSLKTAQENFKKAFVDKKKTLTEEFLVELKIYLEAHKSKSRCQQLLEAMKEGTPLASFLCRNDLCDDLVTDLLNYSIPFVMVTNSKGEYGFIVRSTDRQLTNEAIKKLLERKGTYCEILTGQELIDMIQNVNGLKDKQLLALNGLSIEQLKILEKICRKMGILEVVGEDKMSDGTYRFMVHAKSACKNLNFAQFIITMIMMTEGANKDLNKKRIMNEIIVQKLRARDFDRDKGIKAPIYIVGSSNQYIKIEQNKFEFGYSAMKDGEVRLEPQFFADSSIPDYSKYETSFLNRIPDPVPTTDLNLVMEHFRSNNNGRDSLDFGMDRKERDSYFGEKQLIASLMNSVEKKVQNDQIMNVTGHHLEKTHHTTIEAGKLLNGLITGRVPQGYEEIDMQRIRTEISEYNIDLDSYSSIANSLRAINLTNERGEFLVKGSVVKNANRVYEQSRASSEPVVSEQQKEVEQEQNEMEQG